MSRFAPPRQAAALLAAAVLGGGVAAGAVTAFDGGPTSRTVTTTVAAASGTNATVAAADGTALSAAEIYRRHQGSVGLGVSTADADNGAGATVGAVTSGGPAAKAGLQEGDVITAIGDVPVADGAELAAAVDALAPGKQVGVTYTHDGARHTATVTLGTRPEGAQTTSAEQQQEQQQQQQQSPFELVP